MELLSDHDEVAQIAQLHTPRLGRWFSRRFARLARFWNLHTLVVVGPLFNFNPGAGALLVGAIRAARGPARRRHTDAAADTSGPAAALIIEFSAQHLPLYPSPPAPAELRRRYRNKRTGALQLDTKQAPSWLFASLTFRYKSALVAVAPRAAGRRGREARQQSPVSTVEMRRVLVVDPQVRLRPDRQRLLVVDEAWLLLQHRDGGRFLESIVRLARSYGLGLVFITQDVKNVLQDPRGSVIAENVFTTLLLRQSSKSQQQTSQTQQLVAEQFGLSAEEQRMLGSAQPGHGLFWSDPGAYTCT